LFFGSPWPDGLVFSSDKGPRNAAINPDQLVQIHDAFAAAGIPPSSMIEAIKTIVLTHKWSRHRPGLDAEVFDAILLY
jgi:hypothetical protein